VVVFKKQPGICRQNLKAGRFTEKPKFLIALEHLLGSGDIGPVFLQGRYWLWLSGAWLFQEILRFSSVTSTFPNHSVMSLADSRVSWDGLKGTGTSQTTWHLILAKSFNNCVTLGRLLDLSEFPVLNCSLKIHWGTSLESNNTGLVTWSLLTNCYHLTILFIGIFSLLSNEDNNVVVWFSESSLCSVLLAKSPNLSGLAFESEQKDLAGSE
jgi:hypothetical protein